MNKFKSPQKKALLDIILIVLFNILFWLLFKEKNLFNLLQEYEFGYLLPLILSLPFSLLYFSIRRWFECAKLTSSAQQQISKDVLTKLYNRRALEEKLLIEWQRFSRYKEPFCLIMIHIDDLKIINDSFGHHEGDRIIVEVSEKLLQNTRKTDVCARWSGTEFLILCPVSELIPLVALAERLRADVYCLLKDGVELSISLGVIQVDQEKSIDELLKKVELQLYKAKRMGGNCIVN